MTDEGHARVSQLDLLRAIQSVERNLDGRLESIEGRLNTIEAVQPSTLGPRLNDLERWRDRADGIIIGGLPSRIGAIENDRAEVRGGLRTIKLLGAILSIAVTLLTIASILRGPV